MKIQNREIILDYPIRNEVMGKIAGYHVRPGLFDINGDGARVWCKFYDPHEIRHKL